MKCVILGCSNQVDEEGDMCTPCAEEAEEELTNRMPPEDL